MAHERKKKSRSLLAEPLWLRRQFPALQLQAAIKENNSRKANHATAIMRAACQRKGWNTVNKRMGQKHTSAPTVVEMINAKSKWVQYTTQELVETAIHREISPRFSRAGSASICIGPLFVLSTGLQRRHRSRSRDPGGDIRTPARDRPGDNHNP